MSATAEVPVTLPCNICGGTDFELGPSNRTSITHRRPFCATCRSLERHRVVRAVFDALPHSLTAGTRCLQFSPDPALDPKRFRELVVSVWGGENSLDMQAIALPDGSYDWVYSSHVINHVPDTVAALREMLRVVGEGCVVLNVGGSVFNYATRASEQIVGGDRQFNVYGTLYADDVQAALPEVAVLELVAMDPCSVSLDSVYFASFDQQKLVSMAASALAHNLHARVFPPKRARTIQPAPARAASTPRPRPQGALGTLMTEIEQWKAEGGSARFWVRDDDATTAEPRLVELVELCEREAVPLTLAVIPLPITTGLVDLIMSRSHLTPIQHGFDHQNRETSPDKPKSEFPEDRPAVEALRSIQLGSHVLGELFGARALPVFCSPWGTIAPKFLDRLSSLGFTGYSGSRSGSELHRRATTPRSLSHASCHVAVNRTRREGADELPEDRIVEILISVVRAVRADGSNEPVGIMTHHWGVDASVRDFLKRLFDATRDAGARWVTAQELFPPARVSGSTSMPAQAALH